MMTTLIVAIAVGVVSRSLYLINQRYAADKPIHSRAMSADVPVMPMSQNTMPTTSTDRR